MKPLRPGTPEHEAAITRAIGAYVNGASLEEASRKHRVSYQTVRTRILKSGMKMHTDRYYKGRTRITGIERERFERLLDEHPRLTVDQIAAISGVARTTIRTHLKRRGTYQPGKRGSQPAARWAVSLKNRTRVLKAADLHAKGYSNGQIAVRLGVSRGTVQTWLRQYHAGTFLWQREPIPADLWHKP